MQLDFHHGLLVVVIAKSLGFRASYSCRVRTPAFSHDAVSRPCRRALRESALDTEQLPESVFADAVQRSVEHRFSGPPGLGVWGGWLLWQGAVDLSQ